MVLRIVLSALAGGIVIFIMAGFAFGFLFADYFAGSLPSEFAGINRETPNFVLIIISDFLYSGMLAYVFAVLARIRTFRRGAVTGMIIGFAVSLHLDLISAATTHLTTPPSIAANVAISTLMSGMGGGVVATVLGRLDRGR